VVLTNGRGIFGESLAEFVMGAALFFAKDLRRMVHSQMAERWDPFNIVDLAGQTLGLIGYGDIGRAVARRARAFGMTVLAVRRHPQGDEVVREILPPERKREMLARCDYVVVAAPLTRETRGMIAEPELRAMKPGAVIVNVGRGPVIDESALIRALEQGWIRGAALDVFDTEPLAEGHPFYRLENVLLSPHCADHALDWKHRAMQLFLDNIERFRKGEPLVNVVDKKAGY
jgi:phosphoglycerate dehydrogenase-like enzyme